MNDDPYARAREAGDVPHIDPGIGELGEMDAYALLAFSKKLGRAANRIRWRRTVAHKSSAMARALRACADSIPTYTRREKTGRQWALFAYDADGAEVAVARLEYPKLTTFADEVKPTEIVVVRADLIDMPHLGKTMKHRRRTDG